MQQFKAVLSPTSLWGMESVGRINTCLVSRRLCATNILVFDLNFNYFCFTSWASAETWWPLWNETQCLVHIKGLFYGNNNTTCEGDYTPLCFSQDIIINLIKWTFSSQHENIFPVFFHFTSEKKQAVWDNAACLVVSGFLLASSTGPVERCGIGRWCYFTS